MSPPSRYRVGMDRVADWWPGGTDHEELIVWTEPDQDYVDLSLTTDADATTRPLVHQVIPDASGDEWLVTEERHARFREQYQTKAEAVAAEGHAPKPTNRRNS